MSDYWFVLPRNTRMKEWDFARVQPIETPIDSGTVRTGGLNSPTTRYGAIEVDGQWYSYSGMDCRCSDADLAYAIRHHVVGYDADSETRVLPDGRYVEIAFASQIERDSGIARELSEADLIR